MRSRFGVVVATVIACVAVLVIFLVIVATSGAIDIAADGGYPPGLEWFLRTTAESSIESGAEQVQAPPNLDDPRLQQRGLREYQEMCVTCHGAPGVERSAVGAGLDPRPPRLGRHRGDPRENFWVIKNGIKMSGMPAFGATHGDDTVWAIVAFLDHLPQITPEQYAQQVRAAGMRLEVGEHEEGEHEGGAEGGEAPGSGEGMEAPELGGGTQGGPQG